MMGFWSGLCNGFVGYNPIGAIFGWLITIGLIAALALLAIWLIRRTGGRTTADIAGNIPSPGGSAREVLQLRYAKGEITREQYLQIKNDLS
jgi:putative membrane protein